MELDMIKRGLRAEIKKREKETYATCQTNVRDMCTDVLSKLEEQEARIHELESMSHTDNSAVIDLLSDELEKLRPMEAALEIAEADNKKYIERINELEAENAELKAKLESVQASAYAESVDAGMENRKLKRALWLARAMMADYAAHWTVYVTYMHYHENSFYAFDGDDIFHRHNKNLDGFKLWCFKWETVKGKCLKKAEEYK